MVHDWRPKRSLTPPEGKRTGLLHPKGPAAVPEFIEFDGIAQGVHALPLAGMRIHGKLPFGGQLLQGFFFQVAVFVLAQVVQETAFEHEKAAVDMLCLLYTSPSPRDA